MKNRFTTFKFVLICFVFFVQKVTFSQTKQEIENLKSFAKVYGYVKYFHPSDEASSIDWGKFAIYGAQQILKCKDQAQVLITLNNLFNPIAPSVVFQASSNKNKYDISRIIPNERSKYKTTYWQHLGVSKDMSAQHSAYGSVRVNSVNKIDKTETFGNIVSSLDAATYKGKKIKYTGWVKLMPGTVGSGHLWFRVDKSDKAVGFFDNMEVNPIKDTAWKQYSIIGEVDSSAIKIVFGCFLKGKGSLVVDDLKLAYEDKGRWVEIPLKNGSFEVESIKSKGTSFTKYGNASTTELIKSNVYAGKKAVVIENKEKIETVKGNELFKRSAVIGELIEKEIGNEIFSTVPLVLYVNKKGTFPYANQDSLTKLKRKINEVDDDAGSLSLRLGNVINTFNVFQHFYPYFDVVKVDWMKEFEKALVKSFADTNKYQHGATLLELTATLKDGHVWISGSREYFSVPPFEWELVEGKLVITKVYGDQTKLKVGNVVTEVNGISANEFLSMHAKLISAATEGYLNYLLKSESLNGAYGSSMLLTIDEMQVDIQRSIDLHKDARPVEDVKHNKLYRKLDDNIVYMNLDLIPMDTIKKIMPILETARGIICDLRGYPNGNHDFICHLLKSKDTTKGWMRVPQIMYPDQENIVGYAKYGWGLKPKKPYLGGKVVFIIDGQAISYAESYMGFIEGYKLATIVGQPTAGTNGNTNPFNLPGGYRVSWTGMKVVKHNGTQHHGIGILPNIYVEKTIKGVIEGRDEFLEKAIEEVKKLSN